MLWSFLKFSGFYWLLQPEPVATKKCDKCFPDLLALATNGGVVDRESLVHNLRVNPQQIDDIMKTTIGQDENSLWHQIRIGRITASNFGAILGAIKRNSFPPSLFKRLLGGYQLNGVKAIKWGLTHEQTAFDEFCRVNPHLSATKSGIWLHESGVLGASPDALVDGDGILEIKCPYKYRDATVAEMIADKKFCLHPDNTLKKDHPYYDQVQGQLAITKRKYCHFMVWSQREGIITIVQKDDSWQNNLNLLIRFYFDMLLHKLIE